MARGPAYRHGFREASKLAVDLIHAEANQMNDRSAKAALNSAAHGIGIALKARLEKMDDHQDD